jgi:UDP-glucose:(heptosyl)LPS alpha-1,3-glucosyltransferase
LLRIVSLPICHRPSCLGILHFDKACHDYIQRHPTPIVFSLDRNRFQTHLRAGNGVHAAYLKKREAGLVKKLSFSLNPLHQTLLSLEKRAFEHPKLKLLFTNSFMVKREILEHYRTREEKIAVVHNGVEWERMGTPFSLWQEGRAQMFKEKGLDPTAFQFLFIGHNFLRKGLEKLLYALAFMKKEHFQLSVVGKEKNLPFFVSLSQKLGLSSQVFFLGQQDNSLPFYQMADALVVPSLYDPFANVTLEALAMGLFVLSSLHNGGHEILSPEKGALIPDLNDPSLFAAELKKILHKRKTQESASLIRESVAHLDFSHQLRLITQKTLEVS